MAISIRSQPIQIQPMNNAEFFLRHVRRGPGVLSVMGPTKNWVDYPFNDVPDALKLVERFRDTHSVYATMGTLRAGSSHRRTQDIDSLCGFFLDLDCHGKEGEASDIGEASVALRQFCRATKLPKPSYLVASGHGLHAHWTLAEPIPTADWERVAKKLKALTLAFGLPADPTVTADPARVLRVPNSFNFRDPAHRVEVELLPIPGGDNYSVTEFERSVDDALAEQQGAASTPFRREPSSLGRQISQVRGMDDTPENVELVRQMLRHLDANCGYPEWREIVWAVAASGLADARSLALAWSETGSEWDQRKFETLWDSFDGGRGRSIGFGTLIKKAKEAGYKGPTGHTRVPRNRFPADLPANSRAAFRLLDRSTIMAQPPLRWRVKRLFPEVGIGAIYGPSGSGKSFLGFDLGISIAAGSQWFGHRTAASPVTYVILEGEAGLRNRVQAWEARNAATIPQGFLAMSQPFQLAEPEQVEELGAILPQSGVVIIDTLNRSAPGLDENSSQDMGRILAGMKRLQELTEGLVLVVHHTGKDASKGLRGHSSLLAALDGAIEVERTSSSRCWSSAKVKDGEDGRQVAFKLHVVDLGTDADGDPITSCAVAPDANVLFKPSPPTGAHQKSALSTIRRLLSASMSFGQAGAGAQEPCLLFENAVNETANAIVGVDRKRRGARAREAVHNSMY